MKNLLGILIKNIEMPKQGETITVTICDDGLVFEEYKEPGSVFNAVSVPLHGRLIDADALTKQIEHERYHYTNTDSLAVRFHIGAYGHFLRAISDANTIIPAEEET